MFGIGVANGKFGELLQGALPGKNKNFLVSLPIARYTTARFKLDPNKKSFSIFPHHKIKSALLVKKIMQYFGLPYVGNLIIDSELTEGKGLASSTADMVACARAIAQALGKNLPINILLQFLKEIEPSDGIMYEGIVCFYHRNVVLHNQLGFLPNLMIVGIDEGGKVDTLKFNKEARPYSAQEKFKYSVLLNQLIQSIKEKNLKKIGSIATQSAKAHQEIHPKKHLSLFLDLCRTVNGLGTIVAHSGTYLGILLDKHAPDYFNQLSFIEKKLKDNFLSVEKFETLSHHENQFHSDRTILRAASNV